MSDDEDVLTVEEIEAMNKTELKELLEEEEIEFPAKARVGELRTIAIDALVPEEEDEDDEDDEELELEDDDLELEELEEDEPEEKPKGKAKGKAKKAKSKKPEIKFGAKHLAEYISGETGKNYDPRQIRVLLRKMAKDGRLDRDPVKDARSRYSWSGPEDPEVQAVLKAVKGGEIEKASKESLDKLKEKSKSAKGKSSAKKGKTRRKKKEPEPDEDDVEELDEDDLEDLD